MPYSPEAKFGAKLTPSEDRVVRNLPYGTYKDIATRLGKAEGTIKNHANNAMIKMGVNDKASLVYKYFMGGSNGEAGYINGSDTTSYNRYLDTLNTTITTLEVIIREYKGLMERLSGRTTNHRTGTK